MTAEILGRREDQRLELKSREVLARDPSKIARAVVGMLNAEGGEVWVGVEEEDAVAVAVAPVHEPERAKARLWDYLVDVLDPSPFPEEVTVEPVPAGADPAVLLVKVAPAKEREGRKPYAFRKGGAWYFLRRVGGRNHPMSREEILSRPVGRADDPQLETALDQLSEARRRIRDEARSGLWLALQPVESIELDPQDERLVEIPQVPSLTGNRQSGWHFARTSYQPRLTKDGIEWGLRAETTDVPMTHVEVRERGQLRFWVALDRLSHSNAEAREIWPLKLLEYPISAFRIARILYQGILGPDQRLASDLALFGVAGWGLREGSPGNFSLGNDLPRLEEPDLIWESVVFTFREIEEFPDRCGFRLVRRVYQAFGWREEDMPRLYDRETGRLMLPE